jgi:hypothetical protein
MDRYDLINELTNIGNYAPLTNPGHDNVSYAIKVADFILGLEQNINDIRNIQAQESDTTLKQITALELVIKALTEQVDYLHSEVADCHDKIHALMNAQPAIPQRVLLVPCPICHGLGYQVLLFTSYECNYCNRTGKVDPSKVQAEVPGNALKQLTTLDRQVTEMSRLLAGMSESQLEESRRVSELEQRNQFLMATTRNHEQRLSGHDEDIEKLESVTCTHDKRVKCEDGSYICPDCNEYPLGPLPQKKRCLITGCKNETHADLSLCKEHMPAFDGPIGIPEGEKPAPIKPDYADIAMRLYEAVKRIEEVDVDSALHDGEEGDIHRGQLVYQINWAMKEAEKVRPTLFGFEPTKPEPIKPDYADIGDIAKRLHNTLCYVQHQNERIPELPTDEDKELECIALDEFIAHALRETTPILVEAGLLEPEPPDAPVFDTPDESHDWEVVWSQGLLLLAGQDITWETLEDGLTQEEATGTKLQEWRESLQGGVGVLIKARQKPTQEAQQ